MGHAYLYSFCLFTEVSPQMSSPNALVTNSLIMVLPSPWPSHQITVHNPCTDTRSHIWPFLLPSRVDQRGAAPSPAHGEDVPSPLSFRNVPERGCSYPHPGSGACIASRTFCKPNLLFVCPRVIGSSPSGHRCRLEERRQCGRGGHHELWATAP